MNMYPKAKYTFITTVSELKAIAAAFEKAPVVAVDLEADSMFHYKEKVCLIQMATANDSVIIDPLRIQDLSSLQPVFERRDIKKIFHGADYDIRSLYRDFQIEINNLFDTQLACRFLGVRETGLEAVIKQRFNIPLDKRFQKKDWSIRPLPEEMVEYAAKDAIYLVSLAGTLEKELIQKQRLGWVNEECELLSRVRSASVEDQPLFVRFKGAGKLDRRSLAVLEALLQYRDSVAGKKDKPLFKIMSNDCLLKIAIYKPTDLDQLQHLNVLSRAQIGMYGNALVNEVVQSSKIPSNKLPLYPRKRAQMPEPEVPCRIGALKNYRDMKAEQLDIDPALVCTKAQMGSIAIRNPANVRQLAELNELRQWQLEAFGSEMVSALKNVENNCVDTDGEKHTVTVDM
ncbi:MAG: HRDC domain-containing protein [Desulfobacterales bacterium]|nr:HRDC domain-containing protein [Desulfobacterales bacterium]MDD4072930.1 HRDC domain-containing protein [Desulfobacterales bacterium]